MYESHQSAAGPVRRPEAYRTFSQSEHYAIIHIFSTDFSQSSASSGSGELANVGGLWLMNSWCLSRGGTGGGVEAVVLAVVPVAVAPFSLGVSPLALGASPVVLLAHLLAFLPHLRVHIRHGGCHMLHYPYLCCNSYGGSISGCCCCGCLNILRVCRLGGRSIPPLFLIFTI